MNKGIEFDIYGEALNFLQARAQRKGISLKECLSDCLSIIRLLEDEALKGNVPAIINRNFRKYQRIIL